MNTGSVAACNNRKDPDDPAPGKGSGSVSPHFIIRRPDTARPRSQIGYQMATSQKEQKFNPGRRPPVDLPVRSVWDGKDPVL